MRRRTARNAARLTAVAVATGALGGAVVAVVAPGGGTAAATSGVVPAGPLRTAPARPEPREDGALILRVKGPTPVVARAADPAGGPDWAVRVFRADRTFRERGRVHVAGRDNRCVQLGRLDRGRFGWVDGEGTFRPVRPSLFSSPARCGSRRDDVGGQPVVQVLRALSGLSGDRPSLGSTVTWGLLGPAASDVRVNVDGAISGATSGADRVVLRVGPPTVDVAAVTAQATYPGRGVVSALRTSGHAAILAVRTADPGGGLPYGLAAAKVRGAWCLGSIGRIVQDRVGTVDYRFGTFTETTGAAFHCGGRSPGDPPIPSEMSGGGDGADPIFSEGAPTSGRIARRTPDGMTWVAGAARSDVRALTFRTPHDVRTILPGGPAHAYLVVYDGQFPAGRSEMVVTFGSGRTLHRPLGLGAAF